MNIRLYRGASTTRQAALLSTRQWAFLLLASWGAMVALSGRAFAQTAAAATKVKPIACATTIAACRCQISKTGVYTVSADLNSGQGLTPDGDCIEVKSSKVVLNLGNHNITGPGGTSSDVGIDVLHGSNNDTIVGGVSFAIISGWGTGFYTGGNNGTFSNLDTDSNDFAGIELDGATSNRLTDWDASHEGTFGLWVRNGGNNFVTQGTADSNRDGIFVGCGDAAGEDCKGAKGVSKGNDLVDNFADSNSRYGLALDSNASQTVVNATSASGNGSDDLFDDNASCGSDTWLDDSFTTSNDTGCID